MSKNANTTLQQAVANNPFPDYQDWWPLGSHFTAFMSNSIVAEWRVAGGTDVTLDTVQAYTDRYLQLVYGREAHPTLVDDFLQMPRALTLQSGEFDALSYAFFRSAFELIAAGAGDAKKERRLFTKRVGRRFFEQMHGHLGLDLPSELRNRMQFEQLKTSIAHVGSFLSQEGYLRDHFAFTFEVDVPYAGQQIVQEEEQFLSRLRQDGLAYALYEMGYPVILPSAVYLYHTIGEAQHHSSRTIEELFDQVGYEARETDDFDPGEYPSQRVVELWEIRQRR